MRMIQRMVDHINDEIEGAEEYAERYVELKAISDPRASTYRDMAMDELHHATKLHDFAVQDIEKISAVSPPPVEMEERWRNEHKKYVERVAKVKMILG